MQDQDPNKPADEEFLDEEFEDFNEFEAGGDEFAAPSDEFAGEEFDETAMSDEGWDEFDSGEAAAAGGKNKGYKAGGGLKKLSFNTIVIGIAVLVGVGVLIYQVMTTKPAGGGLERFQSALNFTGSTDGPVLGQQAQQSDTAAPAQTQPQPGNEGFLNNPGVLDNLQQETAQSGAPPMPSPISNETDEQGTQQQPAQPQQAADATLTPMPTPPAANANPDAIGFDEAHPVPRGPDGTPAAQPAPAPAATPDASPSPALDIIRQAQNQRQENKAPNPVEDAVSAAPPAAEPAPAPVQEAAAPPAVESQQAAPAGSTQTDAVLQKLDSLSDRLGNMEQQIAQIRENGQSEMDAMKKDIATLKQGGVSASPVHESARSESADEIVVKKAAPAPKAKAAPVKKQASASKPKAAKSASASWELRAAQPGRAWVSRKGDKEMQSVSPGDTLSGIGQVTRIDYAGGRWVVVGTQGQIRQ